MKQKTVHFVTYWGRYTQQRNVCNIASLFLWTGLWCQVAGLESSMYPSLSLNGAVRLTGLLTYSICNSCVFLVRYMQLCPDAP
jgi:hypothetical protein